MFMSGMNLLTISLNLEINIHKIKPFYHVRYIRWNKGCGFEDGTFDEYSKFPIINTKNKEVN